MAKPSQNDAVMTWHAQGMSIAEIGHRLGVSPDKLREIMAEAGVDQAEMDRPEHDDDKPNTAEVR